MSHVETITDAAEFDAPASVVWALLIDWAAIVDWMSDGYIQSLEMEGEGIGAIRHLLTLNGPRLSERLDAADEATGILELSLPDGPIPETALPSKEQVRLIREVIDPDGMRKHGFRS